MCVQRHSHIQSFLYTSVKQFVNNSKIISISFILLAPPPWLFSQVSTAPEELPLPSASAVAVKLKLKLKLKLKKFFIARILLLSTNPSKEICIYQNLGLSLSWSRR